MAYMPGMSKAHRKHIKENRGGRDDRPAGTPGATFKRQPKYPLGKPLVVAMTEGQIKSQRAFDWHNTSGLIYIHPNDFCIGKQVWWRRKGNVLIGTVVRVFDDMLKPARVRRDGRNYTPSVYDYCDKRGDKPQPLPPQGVKLMQSHSPASLAGMTSHNSLTRPGTIQGALMGPDEYASDIDGRERPWQYTVADYDVRAGRDGKFGIYTRKYDVRLATFAPNSAALRNALARMFNAANALKQSEITKFKRSKLPVGKQIALRQADERKINKGWYTCQCGQWVNDKTCPCSVCRRTWGVADARVKLPKGHRFRYLTDGAD